MRLKKFKIQGFKSFADRVVLNFDSSVVGIVGPNGCGKSNIVDAFRWVMGAQPGKLRGESKEDVLFSGAQSRQPANLVQVSVTLSDVRDELGTVFDEVTITRRMYRNEESEYFINQDAVRLKDIQSLLVGSGIGKNSFAIFEQGKLEQIIHLEPHERRKIFDEVAGIGLFLEKKQEALRKFAGVETNHSRLKDLHGEVEKQLNKLKKQAASARLYQEQKELLTVVEKSLLAMKLARLLEENAHRIEELKSIETLLTGKKSDLESLVSKIEVEKRTARETESSFELAEKKLWESKSALQLLLAEKREKEKSDEQGRVRTEKLKEEQRRAKEAEEKLARELSQKQKEQEVRIANRVIAEKEQLEIKQEQQKLDETLSEERRKQREGQEEQLALVQKEKTLSFALQEKSHESARIVEQGAQTEREIARSEEQAKALESSSATQKKKIDQLIAQVDEKKEIIHLLATKLTEISKEIESDKNTLEKLRDDIAEKSAREKTLKALEAELASKASGTSTLLKEASLSGVVAPISDYVSLKPGSEMLMANALQRFVKTVVVKTNADLKLVLRFAVDNHLQDFSILSLEKTPNFLDNLAVEENIFDALKKNRVITRDGFQIDELGVVVHIPTQTEENNLFLRAKELKTLSSGLVKLQEARAQLQEKLTALLATQKEKEAERQKVEQERRQQEMSLLQENLLYQRSLADQKKFHEGAASLKENLQNNQKLQKASKAAHAELAKELEEHQKGSSVRLELFAKLNNKIEGLSAAWQGLQKRSALAMQKFEDAFRGEKQLAAEIGLIEGMIRERKEREKTLESEIAASMAQKTEMQEGLQALEKAILEKKVAQEKLEQVAQQLKEILQEKRQGIQQLDKESQAQQKALQELEKKSHTLEVKRAEKQSAVNMCELELQERFQISGEQASTDTTLIRDQSKEDLEKKLHQLRDKVANSSSVNLSSIEELKVEEERFGFLDKQLEDLTTAKKDLEALIVQLEKQARKKFQETFTKVRESFRKNFGLLFEGGEADLIFTESADHKEAGIEITAKPPGKKMRTLSLLSGGEKCLTSLALLFSLFEVRPAPFCILDEVDAPLDDSNVERFTRLLQHFAEKTQFIIVTHNKRTMAIADLLFGVSMEEKGISKLLSLSFEKKMATELVPELT